jgi:hypothetical protein
VAAVHDTTAGQLDTTSGANGNFTCTGRNVSASRMCVFFFIGDGGTATALTSVTSPNLTWTRRVNVADAGTNQRLEAWTAWAASALTGEVITTAGGGSYNRRNFVLSQVSGSDTNGATGTGTATDVDGVPADPSLSVTADADALVLAALIGRGTDDTTEDGNTTQRYSTGSWAGFAFGERVWSRAGVGGATTLASTGSDPLYWRMAGIEIKAAAGAGGGSSRRPSTRTRMGVGL